MPIERISAGLAFHNTVESAFLTNLIGAIGFRQREWRLAGGGRTRVDLAVVSNDDAVLTIIEIRGTDWDKILPGASNGTFGCIFARYRTV